MFRKNNNNKANSSKNCINPVFEKWILDWRDDAVAKDLQSKHTYNKCLNSIRKYPLPLNTGKECIILEGFGDKICKLIDDKLNRFLRDGGVLHEIDMSNHSSCSSDEEIQTSKPTKSKKAIVVNNDKDDDDDDDEDDNDLIRVEKDNSSVLNAKPANSLIKIGQNKSNKKATSDDDHENKTNKRAKTTANNSSTNKRSYAPEYRSGPYAILTALFNNESESNELDMLKKDLIKKAQEHCDSSFTTTDPNSRYTAWNSMTSLVKKNLVSKDNKLPAKYRLTEDGRNLASTMLHGSKENSVPINQSEINPSGYQSKSTKIQKKQPTSTLVESSSSSSSEEEVEYEAKSVNKLLSPQSPPLPVKNVKNTDCIEILSEDSDNDIITIDDAKSKKVTNEVTIIDDNSDSDSLPDIDIGVVSSHNKSPIKSTKPIQQSTNKNLTKIGNTNQPNSVIANDKPCASTNYKEPSVIYSLTPGSFDIMLFVDNCEQSHAKRQDLLIDELKKSKIKFDIGKLNVGDFTWIARHKSLKYEDIILNFIVERKRMDDFCQSILDGRYKEQKFRIKKCGITKVVYLIEEHGSTKHMSIPEKSLIQADVNTQLIDHLIVHHTTDPKDSAYYLIEMTNFLTRLFQNKTLNACSKQDLDEFNKANSQALTNNNYFMRFDEFNKFSNKNKPLTITEMFAKCLMKIQGVSQEKCVAIIDLYPTPQSLFNEYSKCIDDSKREKLLSNVKYGSQLRNIGPVISKLIAQLFYTNGSLN